LITLDGDVDVIEIALVPFDTVNDAELTAGNTPSVARNV
jgi:hypothetical protein